MIQYCRLCGLNNQHLCLTVLGAEKSKIKEPTEEAPRGSSVPDLESASCLLTGLHIRHEEIGRAEGERMLALPILVRTLISFRGSHGLS